MKAIECGAHAFAGWAEVPPVPTPLVTILGGGRGVTFPLTPHEVDLAYSATNGLLCSGLNPSASRESEF